GWIAAGLPKALRNQRPARCRPGTASARPAAALAPPGGRGCAAVRGPTGGKADLRKHGKHGRASSWKSSRKVEKWGSRRSGCGIGKWRQLGKRRFQRIRQLVANAVKADDAGNALDAALAPAPGDVDH